MAIVRWTAQAPVEPDLLDQAKVAQRLYVSRTTIWRLANRGDIRTVRIGSRTLIPRTELHQMITVVTDERLEDSRRAGNSSVAK